MPSIILEGVDGSGKSTLLQSAARYTPPDTINLHAGPLKGDPIEAYLGPLLTYKPGLDWVLCDRWHVGELVYGPLYRGASKLLPHVAFYIEQFLTTRGVYRLIMDTDYVTVVDRMEKRGEDFLQPEHVRLVMDFYEQYAQDNGWDLVPEGYNTNRLPESLVLSARALATPAQSLYATNRTFVGSTAPDVMFVLSQDDTRSQVAGVPYQGSEAAGIVACAYRLKQEMGLKTAYVYGQSALDSLVSRVMPKMTVAVGTKAYHATQGRIPQHQISVVDRMHERQRSRPTEYASYIFEEITS